MTEIYFHNKKKHSNNIFNNNFPFDFFNVTMGTTKVSESKEMKPAKTGCSRRISKAELRKDSSYSKFNMEQNKKDYQTKLAKFKDLIKEKKNDITKLHEKIDDIKDEIQKKQEDIDVFEDTVEHFKKHISNIKGDLKKLNY